MSVLTADAVRLFASQRVARGVSRRTYEAYQYRLGRFAKEFERVPLTPEEIWGFLAKCGPADETRESYWKLLRAFYNWMEEQKAIDVNPMRQVKRPFVKRKIARSLTPDELKRLLNGPHTFEERTFLYLLADTGMRLSEGLSITRARIRDGTVIVDGKVGEREVPVSPEVLQMVRYALPWPWGSYQSASAAVRRCFRRVGLTGHRMGAHALRHTFTRLWKGDESVLIGILGWTSPRMLKRYKPYDINRALTQHREGKPTLGLLP